SASGRAICTCSKIASTYESACVLECGAAAAWRVRSQCVARAERRFRSHSLSKLRVAEKSLRPMGSSRHGIGEPCAIQSGADQSQHTGFTSATLLRAPHSKTQADSYIG